MKASIRLTYQQAKAWAHSQDPLIDGVKGWRSLKSAGGLPLGMPAWPQGYYKEFESWGQFLGTGTMAAIRRSFVSYEEAKRWAQKQVPAITKKALWQEVVRTKGIPANIPTDPRSHYKEKFMGWGDFLGTGRIAPHKRSFLSYREVKIWVQEQVPVIYSQKEYVRQAKASGRTDIPLNPPVTYEKEFEGWPCFLGVRRLGPSSMIERMLKQELSSFLPVDARSVSRLPGVGGETIQADIYIPSLNLVIEYDGSRFHEGKEDKDRAKMESIRKVNPELRFLRIREAPLERLTEWDLLVPPSLDALRLTKDVVIHLLRLCLIPREIEMQAVSYLNRTEPAGDTIVGARWRSYEKAKEWARQQGITSVMQWRRMIGEPGVIPKDIPTNPNQVYGKNFLGWTDFLGTPIVATQHRKFWSYERAKDWARQKNITTGRQWNSLSISGRLPKSLPSNPQVTYKAQWRGWGNFLGVGKAKDQEWASFEEICRWCAQQNPPIGSFAQWQEAKDKDDFPKHFPKSLHYHFGKGAFERMRGLILLIKS